MASPKVRVAFNVYYTRADAAEVVIDKEDFEAWAQQFNDPPLTLETADAADVYNYLADRAIEIPDEGRGVGDLQFDGAADLEIIGEEELET